MKINIDDYTIEELKKALESKEKKIEEKNKPKRKAIIDFHRLVKQCEEYINNLSSYEDDEEYINNLSSYEDDEHYIYETAMECVFGEDVWDWINKKLVRGGIYD